MASLSSYLAGVILVLAPVWAFISVWAGSSFGHYTAVRLILEILLALLALLAIGILIIDRKLSSKFINQKWFWPLAAFIALEIIWGIVAHFSHNVSLKALGYAWIVDLRYLLFFATVFIAASKSGWLISHGRELIFIPAIIVAIFAVLQFFVLPLNFLQHFGYSTKTIFPYETINHNQNFPRVMSFTRGANPLGAYLLVIITLLAAWLTKNKSRLLVSGGLILTILALIFSFSRSAWLGVVVSLILLGWLLIKSSRVKKIALAGAAVIILIIVLVGLGLHNNAQFQNYFLHTQNHSASKISSNQGHVAALESGWHDFSIEPLGKGPGTSGPASVYNHDAPPRISENYYLMIGEEDGWLGLALLLAFFVLIAIEFTRSKNKLSMALLAGFIGLAVINLFLPAWTDVTLAYVFWGLAAIVFAGKTSSRQPS